VSGNMSKHFLYWPDYTIIYNRHLSEDHKKAEFLLSAFKELPENKGLFPPDLTCRFFA
jgi:hypothetical protein